MSTVNNYDKSGMRCRDLNDAIWHLLYGNDNNNKNEKTKVVFNKFNCNNCRKDDATFLCGRCKNVSYCDKDCQKIDWHIHKSENCQEPKYLSEAAFLEMLDKAFKSQDFVIKEINFLFEGETKTRRHNLIVVSNPQLIQFTVSDCMKTNAPKVIATNGNLSDELTDKLYDQYEAVTVLNQSINGHSVYDKFRKIKVLLNDNN